MPWLVKTHPLVQIEMNYVRRVGKELEIRQPSTKKPRAGLEIDKKRIRGTFGGLDRELFIIHSAATVVSGHVDLVPVGKF